MLKPKISKKRVRATSLFLLAVIVSSLLIILFGKPHKASAAVARTGSVTNIQSSADSGSQSVTVPSDANLAVVTIEGFSSTTTKISGFTTLTLGGTGMTLQRSDLDSVTDGDQTGIFTLVNPSTGTQTLSWNWGGSTAWSDGGQINVAFYKGVYANGPVGSVGGQGINGASNVATATTASLAIAAGDAVVSTAYYSDSGGGTSQASHASWTNTTAVTGPSNFNNSAGSYAETFPAAGTTTISSVQTNTGATCYTTMSSIVLKAAPSMQTFVGSFTVPATGQLNINQHVTGVGFKPKAVLFWGNGETADAAPHGSSTQNWNMVDLIMGIYDGTSQASIYNSDDFTSGDPNIDTSHALHLTAANAPGGTTNVYIGTVVSMDIDGFTYSFSTINATHGVGVVINYLALGGTDLTNASMQSYTAPTSTGSVNYTGFGFQPDSVILIGGSAQGQGTAGLGFASGSSNQGALSSDYNNPVGTYQRTNQAYVEMLGTTKRYEGSLTGFISDGFTMNWTTVPASSSTFIALGLKGASFSVGNFTQKTSTGSQAYTGTGFKPSALILASDELAASTSVNTTAPLSWMIGGTDGTHRGVITSTSGNCGMDTLDRANLYKTIPDATPSACTGSTSGAADITSMDSNGFTLNYGTSDGTARQVIYWAVGPLTNTAPSAPTLIAPAPGASGTALNPTFQLRASDSSSDYLKYKIQICSDNLCNTVVQTIDETASQTGWSGQDSQGGTAYAGSSSLTSSTVATYSTQTSLASNTTYYWRAYAIDPGGSNTFSSASSIQSFTTTTLSGSVQLNGGTVINGGTTIQ